MPPRRTGMHDWCWQVASYLGTHIILVGVLEGRLCLGLEGGVVSAPEPGEVPDALLPAVAELLGLQGHGGGRVVGSAAGAHAGVVAQSALVQVGVVQAHAHRKPLVLTNKNT